MKFRALRPEFQVKRVVHRNDLEQRQIAAAKIRPEHLIPALVPDRSDRLLSEGGAVLKNCEREWLPAIGATMLGLS